MAALPSQRTKEEIHEEDFGHFPLSHALHGTAKLSEYEQGLVAALGSKDPAALQEFKKANSINGDPSTSDDPMSKIPKQFRRQTFEEFTDPKQGVRYSNQLGALNQHGDVMKFASPPSASAEEAPPLSQRTDSLPHLPATSSASDEASSKRSSAEAGLLDRVEKKRKSLTFPPPSPSDDIFMEDYGYLAHMDKDKSSDPEENP